jgi:hypothetical protein
MADAKLLKSWKITETLLERARNALPVASEQHEHEYMTLWRGIVSFLSTTNWGWH